jgi:hypothetical protein
LSDDAVNKGYRTRITDFNAQTGITTCDIVSASGFDTGYSANTLNKACVTKTNIDPNSLKDNLTSIKHQESLNTNVGNIKYNKQEEQYIRLSKFIASMMTLDPELIDFEDTNNTNLLRFKSSSASLMAIDYQKSINATGGGAISGAVAESLNKANLGYYSNLFSNMSEVYGYLQNLLFVFIGMFFVGKIGFDKGLRALDKSRDGGGDGEWLGKFYVPVLAVGFFFAPIPEDANMNATVVQKMIRFITLESNNIADKASAIGVNTYMQRLYATVGAMSAEGEASMLASQQSAEAQEKIYTDALNTTCRARYPYVGSFLMAADEMAMRHEQFDPNNITKGNGGIDITFSACRLMEYKQKVNQDVKIKSTAYLEKMKKTYHDKEVTNILNKVNDSLQQQQDRLGWPNAFIVPAMSILVESLPMVVQASGGSSSNSLESALSNTMNEQVFKNLNDVISSTQKFRVDPTGGNNSNVTDIGFMVGKLTYMMLPGAKGMYEALKSNKDEAVFISGELAKGSPGATNVKLGVMGGDYANEKTYLTAMAGIYQWMIIRLPVVVSVIAGIIAFIGYIVELAKYFYISPFVVAFALTTKRTHKIVDFMVTGLVVFFRPILLVIFIFFAIFIHTLIQDVFLYYAMDQFVILGSLSGDNKILAAVMELLKNMLQIFGSLGATYIMWKLILTGPVWAMKLVGVDNAQNDMISEALSQRMDRAAFRM